MPWKGGLASHGGTIALLPGTGFLVYAYTKKLPERAVPPETGPKKKEETHYAKPLHA